jgi:hypothetical protein
MKGKNLALTVAFFCIAALVACANSSKSQGDADANDSTQVAAADSANVGAGSLADMATGENEPLDGAPRINEEYDVSVRTFDMDSNDPGPGYEAIIRLDGKTLQVVEGRGYDYPENMLESFGNVWMADVDFDGHTDVLISLGTMPASDQTFTQYDAWLYNSDDGKFYCPQTFRDIYNPEVDVKEHRILSHYIARDGKTKVYSAHYWQKDGNIQQVGKSWTVK